MGEETTRALTARQLIDQAARQFEAHDLVYGHGTDNARDEAAFLVLHACGFSFDCDDEALDRVLPDDVNADARRLVAARIETRCPAAYLTGRMWFAGHEFLVDERTLVPRSPIAELIHDRFAPWINPATVERILDVGTGSGCIAIACALAFPDTEVDALDIDPAALTVAQRNVERHAVTARVNLIEADLLPHRAARYDIIVSNPPYVPSAHLAELPAEYGAEPALALDGGVDGLDYARRLIAAAADWLTPHGILVVEVGVAQPALEQAMPELPFFWLEFEHGGEGVFVLSRGDLPSS